MSEAGRLLFDVNVLIALFDPDHPKHVEARLWASAERPLRWASCPITQNGYVRIVMQPSYGAPIGVRKAIERLTEAVTTTDHEFWPDDVSLLEAPLFRTKHLIGHSQITDAYLLALTVKRGGRLVTFDAGMPIDAVVGATKDHVVRLS